MWLDLNNSITASANDLQVIFLDIIVLILLNLGKLGVVAGILLNMSRSWIVEANRVLDMVIDVPGVDWHVDVVVFLLQSCESGDNFALFTWKQISLLRLKLNFILVLIRDLPLVLEWDARLVQDVDRLFRGDTLVNGREEELLLIAELE